MRLLSIVVPCYNEEEVLPYFYESIVEIISSMNEVETELILVNDGSKDNTIDTIKRLATIDDRVKYISFSRNFGKEAGILAGLRVAKGDFVAVIDADLQHPPELIPKMIEIIWNEGYDSVATRKIKRNGESHIKVFFSKMFYKVINKMSDADITDGACDFRMMTRQMTNSILELSEFHRFSKGIFGWVGYKTKWLEYENKERIAGQSKWSFWKLFQYAIEGIVAFSTTPLRIASIFGVLLSIISILYLVFIVADWLLFGNSVAGWPTLMCVLLVVSGGQFLFIGIIGEYLAKTYMEVKSRPNFIVKETNIDIKEQNIKDECKRVI